MKKIRFAFIGCGVIAGYYAEVVERLGHEISVVVSRKGSASIRDFAIKHQVGERIEGFDNFFNNFKKLYDSVDCILVCTPWDITEKIIIKVLSLGKPLMAEKPVVLSMDAFRRLAKSKNVKNLFPACNRKFYDFIPELKKKITKHKPLAVDVLSAEPLDMIVKKLGIRIKKYMPYYYTIHIIDLLYFLFNDLKTEIVRGHLKNGDKSLICQLAAGPAKIPVQMRIIMNCPQNSSIKIFFEKEVVELCPLESMSTYNGLKRIVKNKIALYTPVLKERIGTGRDFKPGFLNQTQFFLKYFVLRKNNTLKEIERLKKVTALCQLFTKAQ